MKILKFGGSTVRSETDFNKIVSLVADLKQNSQETAIVISAISGTTDTLIKISHLAAQRENAYRDLLDQLIQRHMDIDTQVKIREDNSAGCASVDDLLTDLKDILHGVFLVQELTPKTQDYILSFGERIAAVLLCRALEKEGIAVENGDPRMLIKTDNNFGMARVYMDETLALIKSYFESRSAIQIVPGFIGSTRSNETTTLGRGASDLTASLLGAALDAETVEIWTDVDGVMTADPQKVQKAIPIETLSYEEAMELSHFGAKLLRPQAIQPARKYKIPVLIKNANNPAFKGTVIGSSTDSPYMIKGISSIDEVALLRVQGGGLAGVAGIANRLFSALAKDSINVILISQASSEHTICLAVLPNLADAAKKAIEAEFAAEIRSSQIDAVFIENELSIIAVVGENMRKTPGIAGRMFDALGKNGINVSAIAQGSSELNISAVVPKVDESKALNVLHDVFFLSGSKTIHLFVLGTGLIGSTLLKQIREHQQTLQQNAGMEIRVTGIGNVDGWTMDAFGLHLDSWEKSIRENSNPMDLKAWVQEMIAINLPNSIFVDCTGSPDIVNYYADLFCASISIVTPNKIANSGPYERYARLRQTAIKHKVRFLYETNVGAGLPVISTLNDLICSGDKLLKIEAILSGTLSFIFNSYNKEAEFSDVVLEAQKRGLSEPDPRDDLNGLDVARKLLILARECGVALELENINQENILPEKCRNAPDIDTFFKELKAHDALFAKRRDDALSRGEVLRYIACLDGANATITLDAVNADHPFYAISGSDNMIVITTERYQERPLVIKGPGAGAEVTAAGVFADVLRIANYLSR